MGGEYVPSRFIDRVNSKNEGVRAEYCALGGTTMDEPPVYSVIVDRISHEYVLPCLPDRNPCSTAPW